MRPGTKVYLRHPETNNLNWTYENWIDKFPLNINIHKKQDKNQKTRFAHCKSEEV